MPKKSIALFFFGLILFAPLGAWSASSVSWLNLPTGAKQAAFSGSWGALADDLEALGVNPAGLADLSGTEISGLHNQWAQNLSAEHLALGRGFGTSGAALGGDYFNFGQVPLYDLSSFGTPVSNGSFNPVGMDLYAGAGVEVFSGFSLGAGAKIIFQSLVSGVNSTAEALDLGIRYKNRPTGLSFGLALLNLGTTLDGADLPLAVHFSGGYQVQLAVGHEISLGADGALGLNDKDGSTVSLGAEYLYQGVAALRAGYRLASYGQLQGLAGLSAGVGVKLGPAELNYALTTLGDLGMGHQISLGTRLDSGISRPLSAPTGLETGWDGGKVILSWESVREIGVAGYNFYLKRDRGKDFKKVNGKLLESNTVPLAHVKKGSSYYFGITTVSRDGSESSMSQLTFTP